MKILFVVSTLAESGPTNQLFNLIKYLDRARFEPNLLTLSAEGGFSRWGDFQQLGVVLHSLGLSRFWGLFLSRNRLKTLVDRIAPDVVHTQGIRADVLNASVLAGYPTICTSRNYPMADYPAKYGEMLGKVIARKHLSVFRKLNVVACSKTIQTQLAYHDILAKVVQNGVDADIFHPVSSNQDGASRTSLGLPIRGPIILSVGSLIPRKDMKTLITAFGKSGLENAWLVILGDGPELEDLKNEAGESVLLLGNVKNVVDYMTASDLFVSSSLSEGLPNTVLEAMACGLPCVLSDIPSHRELVSVDCGNFFPCGDSGALSDCLVKVDLTKNGDLGCWSRRIIEECFTARKMSQGYEQIYEEIVG